MNGGPQARVSSPPSGRSTFHTSAPRSPSIWVAYGPASTRERSRTTTPSSGCVAPPPDPLIRLSRSRGGGAPGQIGEERLGAERPARRLLQGAAPVPRLAGCEEPGHEE